MSFFKFFKKGKELPVKSNEDFWNWFQKNEKEFYKVLKNKGNVEADFFDKLSSKLKHLREGYWFLAGMYDNNTAELVITADGIYKNIAFVEELIKSAPKIENWKFTALKPASDIDDVNIRMGDLKFSQENLSFYSNDNPEYPDEINITVIYSDYKEDKDSAITNGIYIFIDNYLGELNSVTSIDSLKVISMDEAIKNLIPIKKLKDYIIWRQKEFIEKYEGTRYNTENDSYNSIEATLNNGKPLLAIMNFTLLEWDSKASHPWILTIEILYNGNESGMPDKVTYELMNKFEDELMLVLKDSEGYLNVGRQTADNSREIYFACKDFRLPSKVLSNFTTAYKDKLNVDYDIYKDKYWKSFDRFRPKI